MLPRLYLSFVLLAASPAWCQIGSIPFDTTAQPSSEDRMMTPPPVSGLSFPTAVGAQERSNYLAASVAINTAFDDNVIVGNSGAAIRDEIYSILPTVSLNHTTPRHNLTLLYSPGFSIYQHTSSLNAATQTVDLNYQYQLNQRTSITLNDSFQKSSNVFDQLNSISGEIASNPTSSTPADVVAPYADRLSNTANAGLSYQFSKNGMIGAGGSFTENNYPNSAQASGFYNSNSVGGSVFYSQRLSTLRYFGVTYQYVNSQSSPVNNQTNPVDVQTGVETHTVFGFYTMYFTPTISLSISGGPQYYKASQLSTPELSSWAPSVTASLGWQRNRTNFVATYARTVSGGSGLLGAFNSNNASVSARWLVARGWVTGVTGAYSINKNILPLISSSSPGGHTVAGTALLQHSIGEHFEVAGGYARLHQSYGGITAIADSPDSNREYIVVSYHFTRPLGR
jgi:hypothetical protein